MQSALEFSHTHDIFFFFQAEDGIRDLTVTGVQTCALPIYGEVTADVDRPLHELEVALDDRDQVDLRQARRHVVSQLFRALRPEVSDLLDRAGRLARRGAVALGGAGHICTPSWGPDSVAPNT